MGKIFKMDNLMINMSSIHVEQCECIEEECLCGWNITVWKSKFESCFEVEFQFVTLKSEMVPF